MIDNPCTVRVQNCARLEDDVVITDPDPNVLFDVRREVVKCINLPRKDHGFALIRLHHG